MALNNKAHIDWHMNDRKENAKPPLYADVCISHPDKCDYSWNDDIPLADRFPKDIQFSQDLFEIEDIPISFNHAKLTLVRKKEGVKGKNSEKLVDGKLYAMKAIIKTNRDKWTYRQVKILTQIGVQPNIITLHGLVFHEPDKMPSLLYEYIETDSKSSFPKEGKFTLHHLIRRGPYF